MIYIDATQPAIPALAGTVVDNGNGTISIQKSNGKFACLNPTGGWEERDSPGGPWESFVKGPNGLFADRPWDGKTAAYLVPFVEAN